MSTWGQELLDDCTASCKGANRDILNCWNLFQSAILAYEYGDATKANYIVGYISEILNSPTPSPSPNPDPTPTPTPDPEPEPDPDSVALRNLNVEVQFKPEEATMSIDRIDVDIQNKQDAKPNSMKLIDSSSGVVVADNLPVAETVDVSIEDLPVTYDSEVDFVVEVTDEDNNVHRSAPFRVTTPSQPEPDYDAPELTGMRLVYNSTYETPTINITGIVITVVNKENVVPNSLVLKDLTNNRIVKSGIAVPNRQTTSVGVQNYPVAFNSTVRFVVEATDTEGNTIRSNETTIDIPSQYVHPVISISNIGYEVVGNRVHITSVQGTITNPQNFDDYGVDVNVSPYGEYDNSYYSAAKQLTPSASFNYSLDIWFDLRTDVDNSDMISPDNDGTPHTNEFRVLIDGIGKNGHPGLGHKAIYVCWDDIE